MPVITKLEIERVLIHSPFGRDGQMIGEVLRRAGLEAHICKAIDGFMEELAGGAGALLIGDEALDKASVGRLSTVLQNQPAWSDLPVLVLTSGGEANETSQYRLRMLQPLGNLTLLERPLRTVTLLSAVQTALRARRRQYEILAHLEERDHLLAEVRDRERVYRGIGESIDFGIWVTAKSGRNIYSSESFLRLIGMSQQEFSAAGWRKALHPDQMESTINAWKDCVRLGRAWDVVLEYMGIDGAYHPVLTRGVPIRSESGEILYWAGINLDISREREAADALRESNVSLKRSNSDLEQFAYAASHDLQEPLRNVIIYSQLLAASLPSSALAGDCNQFLDTIVGSARRMEQLIKGLLDYTRAGNVEDEFEDRTDAGLVLKKVLVDLRHRLEEAGATVTAGELPAVPVNEVHLQQLFQNLLSNAIKYRGEEPLKIYVSAKLDSVWTFSVTDNGIGIDPEYARQIFGIFRRLHTANKYPGAGIGLAICQKIVERYHGRIWVDSEPGKGSSFQFTLPA